jgi:DNA-3-methyladenine glycosylase II
VALGDRRALAHLRRDPKLAAIMDRVGPFRLVPRTEGTHFAALARAIVYQQLSGKAAATIYGRVQALFGDRDPTPPALLAIAPETLRAAGLSKQKLGYLLDLARHADDLDALHELADDDIIEQVTRVKGIGLWTAHMFLMFRLGRPDVLPVLDLGIRKAIQRAYRLRKLPEAAKIEALAEGWRPHRTAACWYLWRSLDA